MNTISNFREFTENFYIIPTQSLQSRAPLLRQMSPERRLPKAFELSDFAKQLFMHGLHKRFSHLDEGEFKKLLLKRLDKCHNRNY